MDETAKDETVVDARGHACPMPIILLARALNALPPGASALLLADDPAAEDDLIAFSRSTGHGILELEVSEPGALRARVTKR